MKKISKLLRKCLKSPLIALCGAVMITFGCTTIRYVPVKGETTVEYRDSLITKLDTIEIHRTSVEKVRDYTGLLDSLVLETKYSKAVAWVDTAHSALKGYLEDKDIPLEAVVPHVEEYHQKDSIKVLEVPIEVEVISYRVPKWSWYSLVINILGLILGALVIYLKVRGKS